jgi:hypothetical protein
MIDTLRLVQSLRNAGMTVEQADAITVAVNGELVEIRNALLRTSISRSPSIGLGRALLYVTSGLGSGIVLTFVSFTLVKLGMYAFSLCR